MRMYYDKIRLEKKNGFVSSGLLREAATGPNSKQSCRTFRAPPGLRPGRKERHVRTILEPVHVQGASFRRPNVAG